MHLSAVILAGGESRRMGRDKAWIEWAGRPLIAHAVEKVRALGVEEILISGRAAVDYSALNLPVLLDQTPGFGPMGGVERGLEHCTAPLLLVLAVDLPQMTTALLQKLYGQCDHVTGVVPSVQGELETLAAIYPKRCHAFAREALARARRAARDFASACLREQAVRAFPVSGEEVRCFTNWNHPDDPISRAWGRTASES